MSYVNNQERSRTLNWNRKHNSHRTTNKRKLAERHKRQKKESYNKAKAEERRIAASRDWKAHEPSMHRAKVMAWCFWIIVGLSAGLIAYGFMR